MTQEKSGVRTLGPIRLHGITLLLVEASISYTSVRLRRSEQIVTYSPVSFINIMLA